MNFTDILLVLVSGYAAIVSLLLIAKIKILQSKVNKPKGISLREKELILRLLQTSVNKKIDNMAYSVTIFSDEEINDIKGWLIKNVKIED